MWHPNYISIQASSPRLSLGPGSDLGGSDLGLLNFFSMSALENMVSCNYGYVQLSRREGHVGWNHRERTGRDLGLEMWGPRWGRQGFQQALSKACIQGTCNKTTRPLLGPHCLTTPTPMGSPGQPRLQACSAHRPLLQPLRLTPDLSRNWVKGYGWGKESCVISRTQPGQEWWDVSTCQHKDQDDSRHPAPTVEPLALRPQLLSIRKADREGSE